MENPNVDGFKPISDEEKSHVVGGNAGKQDVCSPIAQEIALVESELLRYPHNSPNGRQLEQQLLLLQKQYQVCEQLKPSGVILG
jgi:predicted  nucleic acid-binding Zn ribbon protein